MNNILFVFEGERTEGKITNSLKKFFLDEKTVIECAYCANIYKLYKEISEDNYLDLFVLLQKLPANEKQLETYKRTDFAEIYLFFDYDGHDTIADDNKICELLDFFNEETEMGKIFISYPMVEALKHFSETIDFKNLKVDAKRNINYKNFVDSQTKKELKQINKYTETSWIQLIDIHLKKMNYVVNDDFSLPKKSISQADIFSNQLEKYINIDNSVAVLSAFPIFLFDYYGYTHIYKLLTS